MCDPILRIKLRLLFLREKNYNQVVFFFKIRINHITITKTIIIIEQHCHLCALNKK